MTQTDNDNELTKSHDMCLTVFANIRDYYNLYYLSIFDLAKI